MTHTGTELRQRIDEIRRQLYAGQLTYDEAKSIAAPVIEQINSIGSQIAKRHGRKHKAITFAAVIR